MRTHGWQGEPPSSDDEAIARILAATDRCVADRCGQTSIADVATELGVSRATVYRYFSSTTALLRAAASEGTRRFLERIAERLSTFNDVSEAVIEGIGVRRLPVAQGVPPLPAVLAMIGLAGVGGTTSAATGPATVGR